MTVRFEAFPLPWFLRKYQVDPLVAKDEFDHRDINNIHIVEK